MATILKDFEQRIDRLESNNITLSNQNQVCAPTLYTAGFSGVLF
jgi:hypothetical protein